MAKKRSSSLSDVPTAAWVGLAAVTAGAIYLATRGSAAAPPGAAAAGEAYERAMMNPATPEGAMFPIWLVMHRTGLVTAPLVAGNAARSREIFAAGMSMAGLAPDATNAQRMQTICTIYKMGQQAGTLSPLPSGSAAFTAYMNRLLSTFRDQCLASGVGYDTP